MQKEEIIEQIKKGVNVEYFSNSFEDKDIAVVAIQQNPQNFKLFEKFHSDKEIVLDLIVPKTLEPLQYMSKKLKNDIGFALELMKKVNLAINYFDEQVKFSPEVIEQVVQDKTMYVNKDFSLYLYENYRENFIDVFKNDISIYNKLPRVLKYNKELILLQYSHKDANQYSIDYIGFPIELKHDFDISLEFLNKISKNAIYFKNIVKFVSLSINENNNLEKFIQIYNKEFNDEIVKMLMKNSSFKKDFNKIYKANPEMKDYFELIKEIRLLNKLEDKTTEASAKRPKI